MDVDMVSLFTMELSRIADMLTPCPATAISMRLAEAQHELMAPHAPSHIQQRSQKHKTEMYVSIFPLISFTAKNAILQWKTVTTRTRLRNDAQSRHPSHTYGNH